MNKTNNFLDNEERKPTNEYPH